MREVAPGDLIFSFMDTRILAIGIAQSYSWECPKRQEFGNAGQNWEVEQVITVLLARPWANRLRPPEQSQAVVWATKSGPRTLLWNALAAAGRRIAALLRLKDDVDSRLA